MIFFKKKNFCIGFIIFISSFIFFLIRIQIPGEQNFDEFHYIPAAKKLLTHEAFPNTEHPPLGKFLIATGIFFFGDHPFGWRIMSGLFGAITLTAVYALGLQLFSCLSFALFITLITITNNMLYVQSRIGMIDTFFAAFFILGLLFFAQALSSKNKWYLLLTGIQLGLAISCKWVGIISIISCFCFYCLYWYKELKPSEWISKSAMGFVCLAMIPLIVYFLTFFPLRFLPHGPQTLGEILLLQKKMYMDQLNVSSPHPYMSHWLQWPFLNRPIWYYFKVIPEKTDYARGIICMGNPVLLFSGIGSIFYCLQQLLLKNALYLLFPVFFYASHYFCWAIIPRKIYFFYYYYPAVLCLGFCVAAAFYCLESKGLRSHYKWYFSLLCSSFFIFYFPILSAFKIPIQLLSLWCWFQCWI